MTFRKIISLKTIIILFVIAYSISAFNFAFANSHNFDIQMKCKSDYRCTGETDCTVNAPEECSIYTSQKCYIKKGETGGECLGVAISGKTFELEFTSYGSATFADFVCRTTNLISQTLLPPIAVLMALVVGFLFLTSRGEPQKISRATTMLFATLAGVFLLLIAPGIVALVNDLFGSALESPACGTDINTNTIITALLNLVNWFAWFTAVVAVAMGLYSGFLYITARGNPQQARQAALVLSYTIIGIAVAVVAFSIITIVQQFIEF